jgi:hypothetical protein
MLALSSSDPWGIWYQSLPTHQPIAGGIQGQLQAGVLPNQEILRYIPTHDMGPEAARDEKQRRGSRPQREMRRRGGTEDSNSSIHFQPLQPNAQGHSHGRCRAGLVDYSS